MNNRNVKSILYLIMFSAMAWACTKAKDLLDVGYTFTVNNSFTLPKMSDSEVALPDTIVNIKGPNINNTIPDEFKKNNVNIDKIKSLTIESFDLTITSPSSKDFSFLRSIKIYMGVDSKGEKLIASKVKINEISPASNKLSLEVQQADIVEYIKSPQYFLRVEVGVAKSNTTDVVIESVMKARVVANPIN